MADDSNIKNILVVDDDPTVLTLLDMTLRKAFKVTKFSNPIKALEFLKTGFKPGVIISDLMMPEMYGTEFLSKTIELVPEAIKIIVTAYSSSKEIIASINKAHAYMFIKKPWEKIELFQSVVVAWDKYEADKKLLSQNQSIENLSEQNIERESSDSDKQLNKKIILLNEESQKDKEKIYELQNIIADLKKQPTSKDSNIKDLAMSFSYLIHEFEKLWFTNHTENVYNIVEYLLKKLNLPIQLQENIKIASLLHNISIIQMPDNLKYKNPNNLNEKQRKQYFYFFSQSLAILNKVKPLSNFHSMISKIWEHKNGSGYPNGLSGDDFGIGSQIIALANIYHTSVYGLTDEQYRKLQINGQISQVYAETDILRKETIKEFYKKTSWFDRDLFYSFQDLIKENICHSLKPNKGELTINLNDMMQINSSEENNSKSDTKEKEKLVGTQDSKKQNLSELTIDQISVGMKTAQNIITTTGMTIVKSETEINDKVLNSMQRFHAKGMLPKTILIYSK